MYLIDTNVISELRKKTKANAGVLSFFRQVSIEKSPLFLSVITLGELQRGVNLIQHRGDQKQAGLLQTWLDNLLKDFSHKILNFEKTEAMVWSKLRVPHPENSIDKQIAATALTYDLTLVTRNEKDFQGLGIDVVNPFS